MAPPGKIRTHINQTDIHAGIQAQGAGIQQAIYTCRSVSDLRQLPAPPRLHLELGARRRTKGIGPAHRLGAARRLGPSSGAGRGGRSGGRVGGQVSHLKQEHVGGNGHEQVDVRSSPLRALPQSLEQAPSAACTAIHSPKARLAPCLQHQQTTPKPHLSHG